MENQEKLTAERSLEIITEQLDQSRRKVSKTTGQSLFVSGLSTMIMAVVIGIVNFSTKTTFGHLLWFILPLIIWVAMKKIHSGKGYTPDSLVGSLVGKTWWTYSIFVVVFFVIVLVWNILFVSRLLPVGDHAFAIVDPTATIMLLMGMAVAITGHLLRSNKLVWLGIVAGIAAFVWEQFGIGSMIMASCTQSVDFIVRINMALPCLTIFLFVLFGVMLPGLILKKRNL